MSCLSIIAELVLPSIFVMADQILPNFSMCHVQYLNSLRIPTMNQDLLFFWDTYSSFFSQQNNQFVDFYVEWVTDVTKY